MESFKLGEFTVEIIDNPHDSLGSEEKNKIIQESIPVTRKAFRNEGVTESDIIIHALEVSTAVYMKNAEGILIAFAGCVPEAVAGQTVIHLKGTALSPEYQGEGLYPILISLRLLREAEKHDTSSLLVGTRTQSPIVFYTMSERLGLFPKVDESVPQSLKQVAKDYAVLAQAKHSDFQPKDGIDFDPDNLIVRRAYGGVNESGEEFGFCMYGNQVPWLKNNEKINNFVRSSLNIDNGDAFVLIGPFLRDNCLNMLSQTVYRMNPYKLPIIERFQK